MKSIFLSKIILTLAIGASATEGSNCVDRVDQLQNHQALNQFVQSNFGGVEGLMALQVQGRVDNRQVQIHMSEMGGQVRRSLGTNEDHLEDAPDGTFLFRTDVGNSQGYRVLARLCLESGSLAIYLYGRTLRSPAQGRRIEISPSQSGSFLASIPRPLGGEASATLVIPNAFLRSNGEVSRVPAGSQ